MPNVTPRPTPCFSAARRRAGGGVAALVTVAIVAACGSDATAPNVTTDRGGPALAATPVGTYVLRGVVGDLSTGQVSGDSAGGAPRATGLAGATVAISLVTRTPTTGDTAKAGTVLTPFARLTTGADGSFAVTGIAHGYYVLDVSPPAGSALKAVRTYAEAWTPANPFRMQITLGR